MSISSFEYYYSLNESAPITIDQIENLKDDKLYVSIGGGIGAGKTFITKKFVNLPIIDVDDFVTEAGSGTYNRANLSSGRKAFNNDLRKALNGYKSFVHMGTNANINGAKTRLELAKKNGFTTILVHVETDPDKALIQCEQRSLLGERNQIPKERIIQSHDDSLNVFNNLIKDNKLVDFHVFHRN